MKCSACGGTFHPATGHVLSDKMQLCGLRAKDFWRWMKGRMGAMSSTRRGDKESFAEAASKSVKGEGK